MAKRGEARLRVRMRETNLISRLYRSRSLWVQTEQKLLHAHLSVPEWRHYIRMRTIDREARHWSIVQLSHPGQSTVWVKRTFKLESSEELSWAADDHDRNKERSDCAKTTPSWSMKQGRPCSFFFPTIQPSIHPFFHPSQLLNLRSLCLVGEKKNSWLWQWK